MIPDKQVNNQGLGFNCESSLVKSKISRPMFSELRNWLRELNLLQGK